MTHAGIKVNKVIAPLIDISRHLGLIMLTCPFWFDKPKCNTVWISTAISEQLSSYGTHALHTNTHIHYNNTVDYKQSLINLYSDLYYVNLYILWTEFYTVDTLLSRNTQTAAILDCIFTDYNTHVLQIITNSEHTHPTGYVTMTYTL